MIKEKIMFGIGIFLVLDGILSLIWAAPDDCMNNTPVGNFIRVIRALIGIYLIYKSREN